MRNNQYKFESEFTELNSCILRVNCENKNRKCYEVLVDFSGDGYPYPIYYFEGKVPYDNEIFKKELFTYLEEKYPDCF